MKARTYLFFESLARCEISGIGGSIITVFIQKVSCKPVALLEPKFFFLEPLGFSETGVRNSFIPDLQRLPPLVLVSFLGSVSGTHFVKDLPSGWGNSPYK